MSRPVSRPLTARTVRAPRLAPLLALLLAGSLLLGLAGLARAQEARDWPRPQGPVADYAQVIPAEYRQKIAALATELWQKTGESVVVATLPSLKDETLEEAAVRLFSQWGIGKKGQDKGVLIMVAVHERRLRIEVGYGLEGVLTDAKSGQIRDQFMVPELKQDHYGPGLYLGAAAVAQLLAQDAGVQLTGVPQLRPRAQEDGGGWGIGGIVVVLFVVFLLLRGGRGGRGGFGGGGGGFLSGLLLGSILGGGRRGGWGDGGGDGGFGGGGDGGFGGFDGGSSGGGGASGDY